MPIYIGLGANLDHPRFGSPQQTLTRALAELEQIGITTVRLSCWYRSSPVPPSDQPWYVNAVADIRTGLGPEATLAALHRIEDGFGRVRTERNAPRWIDLDLLDYQGQVKHRKNNMLFMIPHPRLEERAFVLVPLAELDPGWRHPVTGEPVNSLITQLPPGQKVMPADF
jgi:2-amino-4-hydroxy-6-hydroxymethyldihydropteridine diphosphokinase